MKIGLLTHHTNTITQRRFTTAAENKGHSINFIHISYCYMNVSATKPAMYYHEEKIFEDLDAIIPKISPAHSFYGTAVLRQLEAMGIYTLNNSLSITWARDKLRAFQILAKKNLPLPITGFADSPEESEKLIDVVGGAPLIIRLLEGIEGRGTIFAETHQAAVSVINAFKQLKNNILVQEYIQEANGCDIRCIVLGNEVIGAFERSIENTSDNESTQPPASSTKLITITNKEKIIAIKAAKALKLNFACVDLIRSKRGPLVLDIDCSPNIEMLEKITHINIIEPIMDFLLENAKKRD